MNGDTDPPDAGPPGCLPAAALMERMEEEINRAVRHGTPLCCLLITIGNLLDGDPSQLEIGSAVEVCFEKVSDDVTLPQWRVGR